MNIKKVMTFSDYLFECDGAAAGGGGVAFATPNANGMGNVVSPTVGTTPGSVWGQGSGTIGSGDVVSYNNYEPKNKTNRRKKSKLSKSKKVNFYTKY